MIQLGVFLQLKQDSDNIIHSLIMRKSHFNDEFLVLLGPIISRLFTCSNEEKKLKTNGACSSPILIILIHFLRTPDLLYSGKVLAGNVSFLTIPKHSSLP